MSQADCQVKHVIFYVPLRPGNLMLVECEGGTLAVLRDDRPVPGCLWPHEAMVDAVAEFQRMRQELVRKP